MSDFIKKWTARHTNRKNAVLHAIGIPMTIIAGPFLYHRKFLLGISLILLGYVLQVVGHVFEGSEVGEIMLIKSILKKISGVFKRKK